MSKIEIHSLLENIIEKKIKEINKTKERIPLNKILKKIEKVNYQKRNFKEAIKRKIDRISLIAECKKATPSCGIINRNYDIREIVKEYYNSGFVDALSILTEKNYFLGKISDLTLAKKEVNLPVLRKDFIIDEYQIYESIYYKADAILLISGILNKKQLKILYNKAKSFGLDVVVEVHTKQDIELIDFDVDIIGINNRNLKTFEVDITTTEKLIKYIPKNVVVISESGISSNRDVRYIYDLKVDAILVGSYFMKASNITQALMSLIKFQK
ncbi:MAG: indole-3-glycerol phosphate synthase TrpC [Endomicrobiia bacterium]